MSADRAVGYIVVHNDHGVMTWSKADGRLVSALRREIIGSRGGNGYATAYLTLGDARRAVADTMHVMGSVWRVGDFFTVRVEVPRG